jgi:hypothetical protein
MLIPGKPLAVRLPKNWERAYGYQGSRRFIAAWWAPNGEGPSQAMVDDGLHRTPVIGWPYFIDLAGLLIRGGYGNERLCYHADPPTHCALLDLERRVVRHALLDDALAWLREWDDDPPESPFPGASERVQGGNRSCSICGGYGWKRNGRSYKPCDACRQTSVPLVF